MRSIRKKKDGAAEEVYLCEGLSLAAPVSMPKLNKSLEVFTKGALEVLIVFGAIGGFMSSIGMEEKMPLILLSYILMAAYFSNLFRTKKIWLRDIGYIAYLAVFFIFVALMRRYVNSGFYALMNELLIKISNFYNVSDMRVFQEIISDRTVTVPLAAVFVGNVAIVILNIFLSYFMSETAAVIFGLPVFLVPLFFRQEPKIIYVICVCAGIAGVFALKENRHYRIPKHKEQFLVKENGRMKEIAYGQSGKSAAEMTLCFIILSMFITFLVNMAVPMKEFSYREKTSSLKSQIEQPLGNFLLYGLSALRNMPNTGGMSGGKLGGVSSVLNDNKTDLTVTWLLYSTEPVYLRAFVGSVYAGDHWEKDEEGLLPNPEKTEEDKVRMEVRNEDADERYLYIPPNVDAGPEELDRYQNEQGIGWKQTETYEFSPDNRPVDKTGSEEYLHIPEQNREVLEKFCKDAGLHGSGKEIAEQLRSYFEEEYTYTLHPGATPYEADYINHFLEKTKKGLCAHFASATVLILRQMGIPARYVEGYMVDYVTVMEKGKRTDKSPADYYTGETDPDGPAVVSVEVPDGNAHAWAEAYLDGQWQVVDVTPPAEEENVETNDFWAMAGISLFDMGSSDGGEAMGALSDTGISMALDAGVGILGLFTGVIVVFAALFFGRFVYRKGVRIAGWHRQGEKENTIAYYAYLCDFMRFAEPEFDRADSHYKQLRVIAPSGSREELMKYANMLEKISYSTHEPPESLAELRKSLKEMLKQKKKTLNWKKRLFLFWKL